jgi:hypothetical protein
MVKCPISSETKDRFLTRIAVTGLLMRGNADSGTPFQKGREAKPICEPTACRRMALIATPN